MHSDTDVPGQAAAPHPDPVAVTSAGAGPDPVTAAVAALRTPGLVVLAGAPGIGRSTVLRRLAEAFHGPTFAGGGLAMLRTMPALPLTRAVRARLPHQDIALLAEAVRSRVRQGLLLLDDLQWADPVTLAAVPIIAGYCRVAVTLRTPHRLPPPIEQSLRDTARIWVTVGPMPPPAAAALVRALLPAAPDGLVAEVVRRSGGVPVAVAALAGQLDRRGPAALAAPDRPDPAATPDTGYTIAAALADLSRPGRTAMAALGLLGRPASPRLLGEGHVELRSAGLITVTSGRAAPVSPYTAEIAAGLLDPAERRALHRRLAQLVPVGEAARHLAAAGAHREAYRAALAAAEAATSTGERADLLMLACTVPEVPVDPRTRRAAAQAALAAGRPGACLRLLDDADRADRADWAEWAGSAVESAVGSTGRSSSDPQHAGDVGSAAAAVLRGEALLQRHMPQAAADAVRDVGDHVPADLRGGRDRIRLLAALATDPDAARPLLDGIVRVYGDAPEHPGLRAAVAAARAVARDPGWEHGLASAAAAAGAHGDVLAARWSAWLLVEALVDDGRLAEAGSAAEAAEQACAEDLAYSWQTRFAAARLWCTALRGDLDTVVRRAGDLVDRALPSAAYGYAVAALSLAEADGGLLRPARDRLAASPDRHCPPAPAAALDWVTREAAWLDGQPDLASRVDDVRDGLVDGLRMITALWARHDGAPPADGAPTGGAGPPVPRRVRQPVQATLQAWADRLPGGPQTVAPVGPQTVVPDVDQSSPARPVDAFARAADAWRGVAVREQVRCLLAVAAFATEPGDAVAALLAAETLAADAGLVVLAGRVRRGLRQHAVRRDVRGPRSGDALTDREREVLRLVAAGEPTRRIAGQLGISRETVETHIRAGMRKLGARTRTEAAVRAMEAGS